MANKYTAVVKIQIGKQTYNLVYNWNAIAEVKSYYPGDDIITKLNGGTDPILLAKVLAAGLKEYHQEITSKQILEISPPIFKMVKAIDDAMNYAYFGPEGYEETKALKKKINLKLKNLLIQLKKL